MTPEEPFRLGEMANPPKRRRLVWPILVSAIALVLAAVGLAVAFADRSAHPTNAAGTSSATAVTSTVVAPTSTPSATPAVDIAGRTVCAVVKQWQDGGMPDVTEALVRQIHDSSIKSTLPDVVYRGNDLYDTWSKTKIEAQVDGLNPAEVQLRMFSPMIHLETACVQAGYDR